MNSEASSLGVIRTDAAAAAALQPQRREILGALAEPGSASSLSRELGLPRQRINYHLRELEKQGLVELVEERRRGNCLERVVRATARSYLISPEALGALGSDPERVSDRLSAAYLIATAGRAVCELAELQSRAEAAGRRLATLTLATEVRFRSAADRNAFTEELAEALAVLAARYHDDAAPEGRSFRFFVGGHPVLAGETPTVSGTAAREVSGTAEEEER
jgi:DNA-binding transcriptional ArsR family regulator